MSNLPEKATVIGCGVIGSGWAARLALHGVPVKCFDPSTRAEAAKDEVLALARSAWQQLDIQPAAEAPIEMAQTLEDAVADAALVVESVPERMDAKRSVYAQIEESAPSTALIASSTSGFKPTELQQGMAHPERLFVAHPFNPVYLLPLVELVAGTATNEDVMSRAAEIYGALSMKALRVRVEIDAFIADRLLEAVWREALWLINDGVATTEEIDDAITYGFGLRWAQMGLFETYRIAGGEGGMRHFIQQFGESLSWPWTKLMDTPELTDSLIDDIAFQSDEQSGHMDLRELEQMRDRNITGFLKVLEQNRWAAGKTTAQARQNASDNT